MKNKLIKNLSDKDFEEFVDIRVSFLAEVRDVCYKYGAKIFLDGGTLLGAIRDKQIIRWDNDLDAGLKIEYLNHDMIQELKYKFHVKYESLPYENFYFLALRKKKSDNKMWKFQGNIDMWIDIYFYYPYKDNIRLMCPDTPRIKHGKIFQLPDDAINSYKEIDFYNEKFLVPSDFEKWLSAYYGPSWRTPDPKWTKAKNWSRDIKYELKDYSNLKFNINKLF